MVDLNPQQFPGTEANPQGRLFSPLGMRKQPHEQSPLEFANSPRSWWHASDRSSLDMMRQRNLNGPVESGFHVGPKDVALNRRSAPGNYIHAGRVNWDMVKNAGPDDRPIRDQGSNWNERHHDKVYANDYESSTEEPQPSIIFRDPGPERFKTHTDFVREAVAEGKPNVNREGLYMVGQQDRLRDAAAASRAETSKHMGFDTGPTNMARLWGISKRLGMGSDGPQDGVSLRAIDVRRDFPDEDNIEPPKVTLEPREDGWPRPNTKPDPLAQQKLWGVEVDRKLFRRMSER
jgi:hypothetical protein